MNVSIVNRTPPILQKNAKRAPANSGHHANNGGDIVMHMSDYGANASGTGQAVDKKA